MLFVLLLINDFSERRELPAEIGESFINTRSFGPLG